MFKHIDPLLPELLTSHGFDLDERLEVDLETEFIGQVEIGGTRIRRGGLRYKDVLDLQFPRSLKGG